MKVAGAEDSSATYVAALDAERVQKLKNVFYDMTSVSHAIEIINHPDSNPDDDVDDNWSESILHITVSGMTAEEAAAHYGFSEKQKEMLSELLAERELLRELTGDLSGEIAEAKEILKALPEDLSPERREVVKIACSLVGKVNYFWGGKSRVIGWDSRWGTLQKVWADGSSTTGTWRPFGLDCSGFVDLFSIMPRTEYTIQDRAAAQQNSTRTALKPHGRKRSRVISCSIRVMNMSALWQGSMRMEISSLSTVLPDIIMWSLLALRASP